MYINNKDLLVEIKKFNNDGVISEKLHLLLFNLSKNISYKSNWCGYTWKEDMISDGYLKCLQKIHKFNIDKSQNPFSFFTSIILNFFIDYIKKYKKNEKLKKELELNFKERMLTTFDIRYDDFKKKINN